ncbi:MAG: hypothetical protein RMJ89_04435 [Flammeovirgaceae bacterium]|nr:hypothetical protein [Flammeovirgaceae bacterium]
MEGLTFSYDAQTILIVLGVIFVIFLAIRIFKAFMRIIVLILVVIGVFYFLRGGNFSTLKETAKNIATIALAAKEAGLEEFFEKLPLDKNAHPCQDVRSETKCECIYQPLHRDITNRLSSKELKKLSQDNDLKMIEIKNSLRNVQAEIRQCLLAKNNEDLNKAIERFIQATGNLQQ